MSGTPARLIRKGDMVLFYASNGRTLARVTGVEHAMDDEVVLAYSSNPKPMVGLLITLRRPLIVPCEPRWRTHYWTWWLYPDEPVEVYDKREVRAAK